MTSQTGLLSVEDEYFLISGVTDGTKTLIIVLHHSYTYVTSYGNFEPMSKCATLVATATNNLQFICQLV